MGITTSIKVTDNATNFLKKLRLNVIRAGGSEKALEISYSNLMDFVVKYFKDNEVAYTEMVRSIAKNV